MELPSKYDPKLTEDKWYAYWLQHRFFHSEPDNRPPYTIVIPPPNVTGVLHMGHILNNTIQDIIIRRARMTGYNACWVPGTDHASIATEAKVVAKLKTEGIEKKDISREEFLKHAWEWKEKHGGIILEQLKKLGASCDWNRTCFTMDKSLYDSVIKVFVDLYEKGLIYKGVRMVNWDPQALTAVSDEEVIYREVQSKLYHVNYRIYNTENEWLTIATTRPETILGDTAVCVHPNDERYKHLKGKQVVIPLVERVVPVIFDEYVDMEFGTGALKVTPAHDINDYNLGLKHKLPSIDIFNENGTLNEKAVYFTGKDRFLARELMIKELENLKQLQKTEDITNKVGYSERTDAVIEPKLSLQWFLKMQQMAKPALEVVLSEEVKFYPSKFVNTYRHWMENVKDWCISRQLWWGQQIPAYYAPDGDVFVAVNIEEALVKANAAGKNLTVNDLKQDEDVVDTWFSSWLWPVSVFDGINHPDNKDINYYYPTKDLVTAPEILFFWVARMIMAGIEYRKAVPFSNVYLTGIVRDKIGRKMSKQLGNSPDPIDLMNSYGADGVRMGMLLVSPAGNDLPFDESQCEQGRNFSNKIWNAFRLIQSWKADESVTQPESSKAAVKWFLEALNKAKLELADHFSKYRMSDALLSIYKLIWDDFCSWYLEIIKPAYGKPIDTLTFNQTLGYFEELLLLLHPFMPFITEELWQQIQPRKNGESIMIVQLSEAKNFDEKLISDFDFTSKVVSEIRNFRQEKNIPNKDSVKLKIKLNSNESQKISDSILIKLSNISDLEYVNEKQKDAVCIMVGSSEFYIPVEGNIDVESELKKLNEELEYQKGFCSSILKKLENERFVNSAPAHIVEMERKKLNDARSRIQIIEEQIESFAK